MPKFFLNYGGPGKRYWASDNKNRQPNEPTIEHLKQACQDFFKWPIRERRYQIKGIDVIVYTYGVHRALYLEIPDNALQETRKLFDTICLDAMGFCAEPYSIHSHNCVTSVARTLNALDKRMTVDHVVWPWTLDDSLKKYGQYYPETSVAGQFISKYSEISQREIFSLMKFRYWQEKTIEKPQDIVEHAYGKTSGTGERTKSTLIELGWVTEDKNRMLRPTDKAPPEFRKGLEDFNLDFEKMLELKKLYISYAGKASLNAIQFFSDNPDYETALKRLQVQAEKNPKGASCKVLEHLKTQTKKDEEEEGESRGSNPHH